MTRGGIEALLIDLVAVLPADFLRNFTSTI